MTPAPMSPRLALSLTGISKRYAGVQALSDVSLSVRAGSVHALVGSNGAGKSTLIKIATGAEIADTGEVRITSSPGVAADCGITAIYQELTIVPGMSALSNVFLKAPRQRHFFLSRRRMLEQFRALAARFECDIDPEVRAGTLSIADQQVLEIMRALVNRYRVIIMDEPTASLGERERRNLYRIIESLTAEGTAVVYIGHDLDEVLAISHDVSVLRNGRLVASRPVAQWQRAQLVDSMFDGRAALGRAPTHTPRLARRQALSVAGLEVRPGRVWDFDLAEQEILGIGGLVGSGRTALLHTLAGLRPAHAGRMVLGGVETAFPKSVRAALAAGIMLAPEDRKRQGLVLSLSGLTNAALPALRQVARAGFVRRGAQTALAHRCADAMAFARTALDTPTQHLSGGNQQKLVIGKWLSRRPKILLLDEPTRGIDVGAKAEIYRTIRALCADGMGVILVSSELSELSDHCDRVLLIGAAGSITPLEREQATVERMTQLIFASTRHGSVH